jgi:hypothetical protein
LLAQEVEEEQPSPKRPYAQSLALAGTVRTDFTDVSTDKYKHLAEAYIYNSRPKTRIPIAANNSAVS